jgi:hypothetical protein
MSNPRNSRRNIQITAIFTEEMNQSLEEKVSEEELCAALSSMQNGKSPRPNGFTIEFFKAFYDLIK